ncbi:immune inhibitor A domain-containing protein [Neobacillus niacini]|uniref:immune inhibitor A domain-containing protein n=1 Tax=Neobacillus niacini TaxID=86668 RepID=UPI002559B6C8|nr:immune inhibitor A domain-containing protein [Neobacillus niacini]
MQLNLPQRMLISHNMLFQPSRAISGCMAMPHLLKKVTKRLTKSCQIFSLSTAEQVRNSARTQASSVPINGILPVQAIMENTIKQAHHQMKPHWEHTVVDGVAVDTYNIVPEVGQDLTGYLKVAYPDLVPENFTGRPPSPPSVGVFAHEFAHVLGLPDLYDYGYDSEGVGMYSLMAGGSYGRDMQNRNYSGNSPVHPDAWSKTYLGFAAPKEVTKSTSLTLRPVDQYPDIYKVIVPGSNGREYFLLENRQQKGFDAGLESNADGTALHGLVVYHVVEDILSRSFWRPNEAQNWDFNHLGLAQVPINPDNGERHYAVSVMQADGQYDMEWYLNDGDAGDVFSGKNNVTSISAKGNVAPNTTSLYQWSKKSTETGIQFDHIVEKVDGSITFNVKFTK